MKLFTCQEGEVCRTGDGEVRRGDIQGFDAVLGHLVEVRRVHVAVVIPPETIEWDQQHLLSLVVYRRSEDRWGPEDAETRSPQHGERRRRLCRSAKIWFTKGKQPHEVCQPSNFWAKFHQLILSQWLKRPNLFCMMFMGWLYGSELCSQRSSPVFLLRNCSKAD